MPLALLLLGALFLTAAVRGDKCNGEQCANVLFKTIKDDFTGPNNFIYWGLALFLIGAMGYVKPLKPLSNAFLGLVILVLFIANRGFFTKFMEQIGSTQTPQTSNADFSFGLFGGNGSNPNKIGGSGGIGGTGLLSDKSGIGIVKNLVKGIF